MNRFSLKASVAWIEDSIIVLSGPALAISGIIAGVDLVTGGNILKSMGWLALTWAITLLLTLDFQVLCLGVRAHRVYASNESTRRKAAEIAIAVLIAGAISFVSIQMQSIIARVNAENVTIDLAAIQLGVNTVALIWERSTLVLVLIFMSGWLREHDAPTVEASMPATIDTIQLVNELDARLQQRMEQKIEAVFERVQITIEQAVQNTGEVPALLPPVENDEHVHMLNGSLNPPVENGGKIESKRDVIAAILQRMPDASVEQVAQEAQCSVRTANKWIERLRS